jgi:hemerythrin
MALFEWKDIYSVNVGEIDKQHRVLIDTLNELHEAMLTRKSNEILTKIIKSLVDYTGFHFSFEEKYMKTYNYAGYNDHKKEHDNFVLRVKDFQRQQAEGKLMLSMEIMNFLKDWLKNHILGTDKNYSSFFNEKGLK